LALSLGPVLLDLPAEPAAERLGDDVGAGEGRQGH
jgi:hypothetical protein